MSKWIVHNLTPDRLRIENDTGALLLFAPFERRELDHDTCSRFPLEVLASRGQVSVTQLDEAVAEKRFANVLSVAGTTLIIVIIFLSIISENNPVFARTLGYGILVVGVAGVVLLLRYFQDGRAVVGSWLRQASSLLLILAIGVGLPVYAYDQIYDLGNRASDRLVVTHEFGILLQLFFTIVVCLLPALLYFLFDRQLLGTLRDRFEQSIFRLDDNVQTLQEVRAKYGRRLNEAFGSAIDPGEEARIAPGTRLPIFVATVVITLGWLWVLIPNASLVESTKVVRVSELFSPQRDALTYAFLGAYFFMIGTIVRRYVRGDLKPKAYSAVTVRILLAAISAWVLEIIFGAHNALVLVLAFVVGFFPESLLVLIQEWLREKGIKKAMPSVEQPSPLTDLQGIDVYDRARLQDEGIVNIESLAHHDLIELMLETRIPLTRLVDWVDQAILYIHLSCPTRDAKDGGSALREQLNCSGIRTATDLQGAFESVGPMATVKDSQGATDLLFNAKELAHLDLVLKAMDQDDWLASIRHWRATSRPVIRTRRIDAQGNEQTE